MNRELTSAGITDPRLRAAYRRCRSLNAASGRTFFLATWLLPAAARPAIHALYGFARCADEIVDDMAPDRSWVERIAALDRLTDEVRAGLAAGAAEDPVIAAFVHTVRTYRIDHRHVEDFLASMRMDLPAEAGGVTDYQDFDQLGRYMHGSAAAIGRQVLPVLGTVGDRADAADYAGTLGVAFQLSNLLRDVGEDLDRGRVYLPADELSAFGVDRELLVRCRRAGRTDRRVRAVLRYLVARTRAVYRRAEPGIVLLRPASRPCVRTALIAYRGILDEIEAADYDVLNRRVVVSTRRRLAVAVPQLGRAVLARGPFARVRRPRPAPGA